MTKRTLGLIAIVVGCSSGERSAPVQVDAGAAALQATSVVASLTRFEPLRAQLGRGGKIVTTADAFVAPSNTATFAARVGKTASAPVLLSHPGDDTIWIEIAAADVNAVAGVVDEGAVVFAEAALDTDVVDVVEPARFEELRLLRSPRAAASARYKIRTGPGIASLRVREGHIEAVDGKGHVHFATAPLLAVDSKGVERVATARIEGDVVEVSLSTEGLAYPIALDPTWSAVASLTYRHSGPRATRLASGKVLVVGGGGTGTSVSELYDPVANTWTSSAIGDTAGDGHWLVTMTGDKVLVGGGTAVGAYMWEATGGAGGTWTRKTDPTARRSHPAAVAISGGALLAGGYNGAYLSSVEFYDPVGNSWVAKAPMTSPRWDVGYGVVAGKVIVAGGANSTGSVSVVEEYTIGTNTWAPKAALPMERYNAASLVLADGRLLLAGGSVDGSTRLSTALLYSSSGTWAEVPMINKRLYRPALTQLGSGRVLMIGAPETAPYDQTEVFDPTSNTFWPAAPLTVTREWAELATIGTANEKAVAVGGLTSSASNTAEVFTDAPLGTACSATNPCAVGVCVDGVCCDSACTEQCKACDVAGSIGRCTNVNAQPPHGGRMSCLPFVNCVAGACATSCTADAQCAATFYCNGTTCLRQVARGVACTGTSMCQSGLTCVDGVCCDSASCGTGASCGNAGSLGTCSKNLGTACASGDSVPCASTNCVDGVCCDTACSGKCVACSAAKKGGGANGTCGNIANGSDPDTECPAAACAGATLVNKHVCDGMGACRSNGTTACTAGYLCVGSACASSCSSDASCTTGYYCAGGSCVAKKTNGATCAATNECSSGFCADGVCCNEACGACRACTAALKGSGTDGTCGNAAADTDPHNSCAADSMYPKSCKADGMCNGSGACREYAKASTACDVTTCTGGSIVGKICNGAGLCENSTGVSCAPYACEGSACATSCTSDTQCAGTAYCSTAGTCVTKKTAGTMCAAAKECGTGFCADGVCCDVACDSQCQACDATGNVGKCSPISGKPHGTRTACAGEGTACGGTCDGAVVTGCSYPGSTTNCGSTCDAGTETKKVCDAKGACVDGPTSKCLPYACADTTKCATTCTVDTECATTAGFKCIAGVCGTPASNTCSSDLSSTVDPSGSPSSCGAYKCEKETGTCRKICTASDQCASGFVCNAGSKSCDPVAAPEPGDDGGCSLHGGRSTTSASVLALLALALVARRRRGARG